MMNKDLDTLRDFKITDESKRLKRNVYIYAIINIVILFISAIAGIVDANLNEGGFNSNAVIAFNTILMCSLEIILIFIILKLFSSFIKDDIGSQRAFSKARIVLLNGKYDEIVKDDYEPSRINRIMNVFLTIHIIVVIIDVITSIALSDYRSWAILSICIINILKSIMELFLLINISKFLTLKDSLGRKCVELLGKVNNMKDDYYLNDSKLDENVLKRLVGLTSILSYVFIALYLALVVIFIVASHFGLIQVNFMSILTIPLGGALDVYLLYFLKSYFKFQSELTIALKASIRVLYEDRSSYLEGFNSIYAEKED